MNPNYLLTLPLAQRLYREVAAALPIVDYHNHLSAREIREDRRFENITQLWVAADPYKHRAMRILGVEERYITGAESDEEKFRVWYESLPRLIGNPLFDWSVMELSVVFDMELLPLRPWQEVWQALNEKLQSLSAQSILGKFNIRYSAPCTALTDDLSVFGGSLAPRVYEGGGTEGAGGSLAPRVYEGVAERSESSNKRLPVAIAPLPMGAPEGGGGSIPQNPLDFTDSPQATQNCNTVPQTPSVSFADSSLLKAGAEALRAPQSGLAPSLRGDDLLLPTAALVQKLEEVTGGKIGSLETYLQAVEARLADFREAGCRFADHALDNGFRYLSDDGENEGRFEALLAGKPLSAGEQLSLRSAILKGLLARYAAMDFTVQLHIGAQRSTSTRLKAAAGATGGFAAMGNAADVASLTTLFDDVEKTPQGLPKILLFTLNPADNAVMATLSGSYAKDGCEALVSQGPAWWWCDHYEGMTQMLDVFASHSVLSGFIGMTTDSRSVLSFVRHDYFRRILCQWIADKVSAGRLPEDESLLRDLIRRVCYENAKNRLGE